MPHLDINPSTSPEKLSTITSLPEKSNSNPNINASSDIYSSSQKAHNLPNPEYRRFLEAEQNHQQRNNFYTSHHQQHHEYKSLNPGGYASYNCPPPQPTIIYPSHPHVYASNYPSVTSSQFDRIANGVGHMSMGNSLSAHPSHYASSYSLQSSMSNEVNESLGRNEVERLKMRIIMLEQCQSGHPESTMNSYSSKNSHSSGMSGEMMIEKVNKLEQLLNQREYDFLELEKNHKYELDKLDVIIIETKKSLADKDEQLMNEKDNTESSKREANRLLTQLNERNEYIGQLPTIDEVAITNRKFEKMNAEREVHQAQIEDLEKKVRRAKEFIKENMIQDNLNKERLRTMQQQKDKLETEFANYKLQTQNVGKLLEQCEENASLRAEFELAQKMILTCENQNKSMRTKFEHDLADKRDEAQLEMDAAQALRIELQTNEKTLKTLKNSIKESNGQNQALQHEKLELQEQVRSFELIMSQDTTKLLHLLFVELSGCTNDLDGLVNNCVDMYEGKQIDVSSLLGYANSNYTNPELASKWTQVTGLFNNEYLTKRTKEIKVFRQKLVAIRKIVSDQYAEKLADNMSCVQQ